MKVIIDIPEEIYKLIVNDKDKLIGLAGAVQNSIPLEQIRDEQKKLITANSTSDYSNGVMNCINVIDKYK